MIILLNTSTSVCKLSLLDGEKDHEYNWQADLNLANGLLKFLSDKLSPTNGIIENEQTAMDLLQGVGRRTWVVEGDQTKGTTVHSAVYNLTDLTSYWIANEHWNSPEHTFHYSLQK